MEIQQIPFLFHIITPWNKKYQKPSNTYIQISFTQVV